MKNQSEINDKSLDCSIPISQKKLVLSPNFNDLSNPETFIEDLENNLKDLNEEKSHREIIGKLLTQFTTLDFQLLAYPEVEKIREKLSRLNKDSDEAQELIKQLEKRKVNTKQYRILSIENIVKIATQNNWGLCKNNDFIYLYNGCFWSEIDKELFQKFLGEASQNMGVKWDNAKDYNFREQLFKQFLATQYLSSPPIAKDTVLINLQNGTFEISPKGTKLRAFKRSDFLTYQLPFKYDSQAKAPQFEIYLNKVLPDTERQKVLAEYLGYIFIKNLKLEKTLVLYGTGANGKSVFFDIVTALCGSENITNYSLQNLTEEKGYYRAKINNKLLNYASEINGKLESSIYKALTSGEPVEACLKYGQPFTMEDYAKLIFNCNELPKDVEQTEGFFRRFLIIPFDVTISDNEKDTELAKKIIGKELSGVFNWVLEGLNRVLDQKNFSECKSSVKALEQYRMESNSVQMFLNENGYKSSLEEYVFIKDLYPEYKAFCSEDGFIPFKKTNFIKQLKAQRYLVDRVTGNNLAVYLERKF